MKFKKSTNDICDEILLNYTMDDIECNTTKLIKSLPMLVDNGYACCIKSSDFFYSSYPSELRVACDFIQEYNKSYKKFRRVPGKYEFGSDNSKFAGTNQKLYDLVERVLSPGTYCAKLDKKNYMFLNIVESTGEEIYYKADIYFIGPKFMKWKTLFYKKLDEYREMSNEDKVEYIIYANGTRKEVLFKGFDKLIMYDKENIIKRIDKWVDNIPVYYNTYHMIPKLSIMLWGTAGNGKTTFAQALAKHLGIYQIRNYSKDSFSFNDNKQSSFTSKYAESEIAVIDDIDCVCISRELSKDAQNNTILSYLLEWLDNPPTFYYKAKDGIRYPVSIVIASTNYYEKLDAAVKRHGRFDYTIHMKDFDIAMANEMCATYGLKLSDVISEDIDEETFTISPATLDAYCKANIDKALKSN